MGWILISFLIGLILGGCIGFVALALCVSASQADEAAVKIKKNIHQPPRRLSGVQDRQRYRGSCPIANG